MKWASRGAEPISWFDILVVVLVVIWAIAIVLLIAAVTASPKRASAGDIANFRTARRLAPVILHSDIAVSRDSSHVVKVLLMEVSAYSPTVFECDNDPMTTASGKRVYVGGIAADWRVLPCGSIVIVDGYNNGNPCVVIDQGGAIKGNKLDLFFWHESEAINYGRRRNVRVQVLYVPKATP